MIITYNLQRFIKWISIDLVKISTAHLLGCLGYVRCNKYLTLVESRFVSLKEECKLEENVSPAKIREKGR
jgi:hypothetical protein